MVNYTDIGSGGVFYIDVSVSTTTGKRILTSDIISYDVEESAGEPIHLTFKLKRTPHYYDGNTITLSKQDIILVEHYPYSGDTVASTDLWDSCHAGIIRAITDKGLYQEIDAYSLLYDVQAGNITRVCPSGSDIYTQMGAVFDTFVTPVSSSTTSAPSSATSATWTNPTYVYSSNDTRAVSPTWTYSPIQSLHLLKAGTATGADRMITPAVTTDAVKTAGGAGDMWSVSLLDTDVKVSNFGVRIYGGVYYNNPIDITGFNFAAIPTGAMITGVKVSVEGHYDGTYPSVTFSMDYVSMTVYWTLSTTKGGVHDVTNTLAGDWTFKNTSGLKALKRLQRKADSTNTLPLFIKEMYWTPTIFFVEWASDCLVDLSNANKGIFGKVEWTTRNEDMCNHCIVRYANGAQTYYEDATSISTNGRKTKTLSMPEISSETDALNVATSMVTLLKNGRTIAKCMCDPRSVFPITTMYYSSGVGYIYGVYDTIQGTSAHLGLRKITYSYPAKFLNCEFDTVLFATDYFQLESSDSLGGVVSNTQGFQYSNTPNQGTLFVAGGGDTVVQVPVGTDGQNLVADSSSSGGVKFATPSGNVVGPASATDHAVARYDTTTGKLIQNSTLIADDSGNTSGMGSLSSAGERNNNYFEFIEDFVYTASIPQPWTATIGTGGSITYSSTGGGIITLNTGTTASQTTKITNLSNSLVPTATTTVIEIRCRITSYEMAGLRWGVLDSGGTNYIYVLTNTGDYWRLSSSKAGVAANVDCAVMMDTNWHVWRFVITTSAIYIYQDGSLILSQTNTTYIPTSGMGADFEVYQSESVSKSLKIDYVKAWMPSGGRDTV